MQIMKNFTQKEFTTILGNRQLVPEKDIDDKARVGCVARIDLYKNGSLLNIFAGLDKVNNKFVIQQVL